MKTVQVVKDVVAGIRGDVIVGSLKNLLNSRKNWKPPLEFSFFGPCDDLLQRMRDVSEDEDGFPKTGEELAHWLKTPANAKLVRDAQVAIEFPPDPRRLSHENGKIPERIYVRVERALALPQNHKFAIPF